MTHAHDLAAAREALVDEVGGARRIAHFDPPSRARPGRRRRATHRAMHRARRPIRFRTGASVLATTRAANVLALKLCSICRICVTSNACDRALSVAASQAHRARKRAIGSSSVARRRQRPPAAQSMQTRDQRRQLGRDREAVRGVAEFFEFAAARQQRNHALQHCHRMRIGLGGQRQQASVVSRKARRPRRARVELALRCALVGSSPVNTSSTTRVNGHSISVATSYPR